MGEEVFRADSGARYRVIDQVGAPGGFASVHRVEDETGARYALKRLRLWGLPDRLLRDEADRLRRIDDVNVIRFRDSGSEPSAFLVTELADSGSLRDLVAHARRQRRPLAPAEVIGWGAQLLRGLVAIHRELVHCDVKASNVLRRGEVAKLADLGSARAPGEGAAPGALRTAPASRPPEGWLGGDACRPTAAYDLYGAGVVLFELAALRPPFLARREQEMRRLHLLVAPPRVRELRPELPRAFEQLVAELLHKDPARRPTSAHEAVGRLEACDEAAFVQPRPGNRGNFARPVDRPGRHRIDLP